MDAAGEELADRVRALIHVGGDVEEKRMFGTRAFLVDGRILVGARKNGVLLVRVDEESGAALLTLPGATVAVMGAKTMGNSWLDISPDVLTDDDALMFWIDAAREKGEAARRE